MLYYDVFYVDAQKMRAYGVDSITTNRSKKLFEEMMSEN